MKIVSAGIVLILIMTSCWASATTEMTKQVMLQLPSIQSISIPCDWRETGNSTDRGFFSRDKEGNAFLPRVENPDKVNPPKIICFGNDKDEHLAITYEENADKVQCLKTILSTSPIILNPHDRERMAITLFRQIDTPKKIKVEELNRRTVMYTDEPESTPMRHHWPDEPPITYDYSYYMYTLVGSNGLIRISYYGSAPNRAIWEKLLHSIEWH